jgi:hypothetical protein
VSSKIADLLAFTGLCALLFGIFLLFGEAVTLIVGGAVLIIIGWRLPERSEQNEPD